SLAEAMGTPEDTSFTLLPDPAEPDSAAIAARLADARLDSSKSLDLQIVDFAVRRSLVDVDIARSERLPSISLNGDVGWLSSGDNLRLPADQRVTTFGYSLGISIDNLLFNWGTTDLRVQQRQLDAENMRLSYEQLRRSLAADLLRVQNQVGGALELLLSLR